MAAKNRIIITTHFSLILFVIFPFISACNSGKSDHKLIEGDLYFSWFRFGSFYNQPDSIINRVTIYADTVNINTLDSSEKKYLTLYETLRKENLLYKPYIDMKLDNDSFFKIYFENADYNKIKIYRRQELLNTKKKIRIKMQIRDLGNSMALCTKLISIRKIDGQTFPINKKLKAEDYE
ncbi:MAG: hypothetical protein ABIN97_01825 [Ginsengibacter sp.]